MKKIQFTASCVCAGRNMQAGSLVDPETLTQSELAVLIGAGLAREVERYEVADPEAVNPDPKPAKKGKKK